MYDECLALLADHPEVAEAIPADEVDDMAGIAVTAAMQHGNRGAALTAAGRISNPVQREEILRRYKFYGQLAEMLSDPLEAAELLATQGELPSAIKRLTLGSPPPAMLPLATRLRLHGYALRLVEDKMAAGDRRGARFVLQKAKETWDGPADAATRKQQHLALGQICLAEARSYLPAEGKAPGKEAAASGHVDHDAQGGADQRAKAVQPATAAVAFFVKAANCCGVAAGLAALAAGLRVCDPSTFNSFAAAAQGIKQLGTIRGKASVVSKVLPSVVTEVLTVQVQLRQLLAKLAAPFRLGEQDRALLAAADAFYSVSDLALSRRLTVRCDNTALLSALGAANFTGLAAVRRAAMGKGEMQMAVDPADARAAVVIDLLNSMAAVGDFFSAVVYAVMPRPTETSIPSVVLASQEAKSKMELLLDAYLFNTRTCDALDVCNETTVLYAAPRAASQLQTTLQNQQDVLGAGIAADAFPAILNDATTEAVVFDFKGFAANRLVQPAKALAIGQLVLSRFSRLPATYRLRDQNLAYLLWRTLFVLLRQSARDSKAAALGPKAWQRAMSALAADLRGQKLDTYVLRSGGGRPEHNITLLYRAQQYGFKKNNLHSGVEDVLAYLERCRISETAAATQPLALQAYVELLEAAGGLLCLALAPHCTFLPHPYVRALLCSPVIGQDPLHANQLQLHAVSDLWSGIGHRDLLVMVCRAAALMRSLVPELSPDALRRPGLAADLPRPQDNGAGGGLDWPAMQRTAAARLALLGSTLAAALAVHSTAIYGGGGGTEQLRWGILQTLGAIAPLPGAAQLQQVVSRLLAAATLGEALLGLHLTAQAFDTSVYEVREQGLVEFRGKFRPQAPGCSFDVQQANHTLRRPSAAQQQAAAAMLQLPQLGELAATGAQDAAKVQEEERRESAAVAIQQAWRARAAHRAQLAALGRLRAAARHHGHFQRRFKRLFLDKVAAVRTRLAAQRANEAAAAMEAERRAAAAAGVEGRLKWVVERLEQSILDATACPVCRPDAMGATPGSPTSARAAGGSPTGQGAGFGLAPAAMPFIPHKNLHHHQEAENRFQDYQAMFQQELLPALQFHRDLAPKVSEKLATVKRQGSDPELEHTGHTAERSLADAAGALLAVMDRVEGGRQWGRCGDAKAPVAELRSACVEADKWLKAALETDAWTSIGGRRVASAANAIAQAEQAQTAYESDDDDDGMDDDLADDFAMVSAMQKMQRKGSAPAKGRQARGPSRQPTAQNGFRRGRGNFTFVR